MPKDRNKVIPPAMLEILHARVKFSGNIACDRCGHASFHDTTLLRYAIKCHVCGLPLSLTAPRDMTGCVLTHPAFEEKRAHEERLKTLESVETYLNRGLEKFEFAEVGGRGHAARGH